MNKIYAILLVSVGAALMVLGAGAPIPWAEAFARSPARRQTWLILAGATAGTFGLYRAWRDRDRHN